MTLAVVALGLMLTATTASAQPPTASQTQRSRQHQPLGQRLREGARSGQLTRGELKRLHERLSTFRQHARTLGGDKGTRTAEQRSALRREWRQVNQMLFRMRHNRVHR
jgi:hypothetical protein